jgi:REP element-mobilizing transposase RayT
MLPIVIAYHLIWTVYGYWLPNDPRGSSSDVIRRDIFKDLDALHEGRKRVQPASRDLRAFYARAEPKLRFPILDLSPTDMTCVAEAFAQVVSTMRYTCYACAIMPDHVHLVIRKHKHQAEEMIAHFQRASHLLLRDRGLRDLAHPVWGGPGWKVFLDHPDDVRRTIGYVARNPLEIGLPAQAYPFVPPYDDWPLHPGHNPNSPYARRLRGH